MVKKKINKIEYKLILFFYQQFIKFHHYIRAGYKLHKIKVEKNENFSFGKNVFSFSFFDSQKLIFNNILYIIF